MRRQCIAKWARRSRNSASKSLWGVRGLASEIVAGARKPDWQSARFFESSDEAAAAIVDEVREGDLVLVKGSRSVETDKVVKALKERFPLAGEIG